MIKCKQRNIHTTLILNQSIDAKVLPFDLNVQPDLVQYNCERRVNINRVSEDRILNFDVLTNTEMQSDDDIIIMSG